MGPALLLLALLLASPVTAAPPLPPITVVDAPYEETLRSALPYAAPWAPSAGALPTGWAALPAACASITSLALAPVTYASSGASQARALLLCAGAPGQQPAPPLLLLDALTRAPYALPPAMNASLPWLLAGAGGAAPEGGALPLLALAPCTGAASAAPPLLLRLACALPTADALSGGSCSAEALTLPGLLLPCTAPAQQQQQQQQQQARLWVHGALPGDAASGATLWVSAPGAQPAATTAWALGGSSSAGALRYASSALAQALAYSAPLSLIALGNASALTLLGAPPPPGGPLALLRTEWATDVGAGWGGPIDDAITALVWEDRGGRGDLFIATPSALNTYRAGSGLVGRLAGRDGLPATNITSLALDATLEGRLWLGTSAGVVLYDASVAPAPPLPPSQAQAQQAQQAQQPVDLPWRTRWRFFSGMRWLPPASPAAPTATAVPGSGAGGAALPLLALPPHAAGGALPAPSGPAACSLPWPHTLGRLAGANASAWAVGGGRGALLAVTSGGLGVLASSQWTLASKAAYYGAQLPMFVLAGAAEAGGTGLTAGANAPALGAWDAATTSPDDNNGLWTSLLVTSFAAAANATGSAAAAATAASYLSGLLTLNSVTGIRGLFARSALPPGHALPSPDWRNSSARAGWIWRGDTSSDETAGHVCAYTALAHWLRGSGAPGAAAAAAAADATLVDFARYVVANNLTLIDSTGERTTWGFWDPPTINFSRRYSDTRGVNSLEALAMLAGALAAGPPVNDSAAFAATLDVLLSQPVAYHTNLLNLKIAVPVDDNFSDDELTFVSYLPLLLLLQASPSNSSAAAAAMLAAALPSLARTWALAAPTRPHAWHVFALGLGAAGVAGEGGALGLGELALPTPRAAMTDALWGLRAWPLEPLDWPVDNSARADLLRDGSLNRDMAGGQESRNVFPPNERPYQRLNADPCDLQGGSGRYAMDQAAFLLPYWLARLWGLLQG